MVVMHDIVLVVLCTSLAVMVLRLRARTKATLNPYAHWLGRTCAVTFGGHSYLAVCVAVSWHGGVAVKGMTIRTRKTVWISKHDVPEIVRWL